MQNIIATLLEAQIEAFSKEFTDTSRNVFYDDTKKKLIHAGEFGMLREACVRELLTNFLPGIYGVSHGYIIGQNSEISHQCDLIIYHRNYTPYLHTPEGQRFFPVESVIAVGEIKSKVDGTILDDALEKLTRIKLMRDAITDAAIARVRPHSDRKYDPVNNIRDQLVTFVICQEYSCSNTVLSERIKKSWSGSAPRHRANLITAIKGGTCTYKDRNNKSWMYPVEPKSPASDELPVRLVTPTPDSIGHLALFFRYLLLLVEDTTVLYPELTRHLRDLLSCEAEDLE